MVAGDVKMRVKRLAAKRRRDARATAKLESSSDSVTEKIIETSMGRVNNPSACVTKAVGGETREEKLRGATRLLGGCGRANQCQNGMMKEVEANGARVLPGMREMMKEVKKIGKKDTVRRLMATEEARMIGEPSA